MIVGKKGGLALESITEAAFIIDGHMNVVVWNEGMEGLTKLTQREVVGNALPQIMDQFSQGWFVTCLEKALKGKGGFSSVPLSFDDLQVFTPSFTPMESSDEQSVSCLVMFHRSFRDLRKKEEDSRYKPLIEESPVATAIYRPDGTPKYYNRAYGNIWGAGSEIGRKLVKSGSYNILEDEQLDELGMRPFLEKGFSGETADIPCIAYNPERTRALRPYGMDITKFIKGHIFPIMDEGGMVEEVVLVISDVTYQMQAEEILTENHLKFQLLTMGLPGVIYEYEQEGDNAIVKYISQGCIEMFGYTPEEILHDPLLIQSLVHPEDVDQFIRTSNYSAHNAIKWEWEGRFIISGQTKWIEGKSDTHGSNPKVRYGMLLDVTERKLAEQRSKHNELLFTQLFDNSPLGLVLLDEQHKVLQVNQGFINIFGYSRQDLLGCQVNDIIVPEGYKEEALDIELLTAEGEINSIESMRRHKNGSLVPVIIYGVPVALGNETIGIYGIYVDITDRKKVENELQVRNEELDNFVYKVSHDLRAPLSSVLGLVYLARHDNSRNLLKTYIDLIGNRVEQLDHFINDVLSHSKNLKLQLEVSEIDLNDTVTRCFEELSYLPNAENIKKEVNIHPAEFYSDQWRINEVFRNLISNTIKYLDPAKAEHFVTIDIDVSDIQVEICVSDNGIGISQATIPKIFDMFYRATEFSEGSGIGLYIVKNAVDKLGGRIDVSSKEGDGTTFKIVLPNMKDSWKSSY